MPIYRYKCSVCGRAREIFKRIAELDRVENCLHCNFEMNRVVVAPAVLGDYPGYECPVTGKWIEGRRAHEENLKRTNCRVFEPGEREAYQRSVVQAEAELEKSVEETVDGFLANLPTDKRESLVAGLENGLDAAVVRQTLKGD